jgi:hypothetical protein
VCSTTCAVTACPTAISSLIFQQKAAAQCSTAEAHVGNHLQQQLSLMIIIFNAAAATAITTPAAATASAALVGARR